MNPIDQLDNLEKINAEKTKQTINKTIKSYDFLWQQDNLIFAAILALIFIVSLALSTQLSSIIKKRKKIKNTALINVTSRNALTSVILSIFLWSAYFIAGWFSYLQEPFELFATLSTTWSIIYLLTQIGDRSLSSRFFAFFVWAIIALHTTTYLDEFLSFSKKLSIDAGNIKISLYSVISAYTIFGVLFWVSAKIEFLFNKVIARSHSLTRAQKVLYSKIIKFLLISLIFLVGFRMIGVDITSIAVISGAIAVGIGFGLQKIFSNLISGIILLVDKSIKPGDVIAIGDAYGVVTNLEARYASIITRDGKKHLIPNETLVTETVENWSFRDDKLRLNVTVGVSYNSDPKEVQKIILACANSHPRVLKNPEPVCLFTNFGESSLDFELRFWIEDPINGTGFPQSEIRLAIWEQLKNSNIEIPYPHRQVIIKNES